MIPMPPAGSGIAPAAVSRLLVNAERPIGAELPSGVLRAATAGRRAGLTLAGRRTGPTLAGSRAGLTLAGSAASLVMAGWRGIEAVSRLCTANRDWSGQLAEGMPYRGISAVLSASVRSLAAYRGTALLRHRLDVGERP
jgi:hypothetical protein